MPGLKELSRHLQSVNTVGQVASAMRNSSTAKYSRLNRKFEEYRLYAASFMRICHLLPDRVRAYGDINEQAPVCYVLIGGKKGLCGPYNSALSEFALPILKENRDAVVVACNRKAKELCRAAEIVPAMEADLSEMASYEEMIPIAGFLESGFREGRFSSVRLIAQHFANALTQIPRDVRLLPFPSEEEEESLFGIKIPGGVKYDPADTLLLPDEESISRNLEMLGLQAALYCAALDAALAFQASTMVAMRTACDNAQEMAADLKLQISRKRQASITAGVTEIASAQNAEEF